MTFSDYQSAAARTINPALTPERRPLDASAGLAEEAGEVMGLVRKHVFVGHPLDRGRAIAELGDALWCIAALACSLGSSLDEVAASNLEKLRARYPDGFSAERSRARDE